MQTVMKQKEPVIKSLPKVIDHSSPDFQYTVNREYNLKERMQELIGRNDDFSGELEGINLVIGIILSIALIIFAAL